MSGIRCAMLSMTAGDTRAGGGGRKKTIPGTLAGSVDRGGVALADGRHGQDQGQATQGAAWFDLTAHKCSDLGERNGDSARGSRSPPPYLGPSWAFSRCGARKARDFAL